MSDKKTFIKSSAVPDKDAFRQQLTNIFSEILSLPHWVAFLEAIRNKAPVEIGHRAGPDHAGLKVTVQQQLGSLDIALSTFEKPNEGYAVKVSLTVLHNAAHYSAVRVRCLGQITWVIPEELKDDVITKVQALADLETVKNYKAPEPSKEYIPIGDRDKNTFILPDLLDETVGSFLGTISDRLRDDPNYKLTPDDCDVIAAGYERIEKLTNRLCIYEMAFGGSLLTASKLKDCLRVFTPCWEDTRNGGRLHERGSRPALSNLLAHWNEEAGLEPCPFILGGDRGRFVNVEWISWKKKAAGPDVYRESPEAEESRLVLMAAERAVQILFPTEEAREGINWSVNDSRQPRAGRTPEDVLLPYEIRITRVYSQRV